MTWIPKGVVFSRFATRDVCFALQIVVVVRGCLQLGNLSASCEITLEAPLLPSARLTSRTGEACEAGLRWIAGLHRPTKATGQLARHTGAWALPTR